MQESNWSSFSYRPSEEGGREVWRKNPEDKQFPIQTEQTRLTKNLLFYYYYYYYYCYVIAHWFVVLVNGFFLKFGGNKPPQISRTFRSILAVYNIPLFCSSTSRVFIPNFSNLFRSFFGIAPIAPITIGVMFTFIFHIFFNSLRRSWYFSIFSCSFNSISLSYCMAKSMISQYLLTY